MVSVCTMSKLQLVFISDFSVPAVHICEDRNPPPEINKLYRFLRNSLKQFITVSCLPSSLFFQVCVRELSLIGGWVLTKQSVVFVCVKEKGRSLRWKQKILERTTVNIVDRWSERDRWTWRELAEKTNGLLKVKSHLESVIAYVFTQSQVCD